MEESNRLKCGHLMVHREIYDCGQHRVRGQEVAEVCLFGTCECCGSGTDGMADICPSCFIGKNGDICHACGTPRPGV